MLSRPKNRCVPIGDRRQVAIKVCNITVGLNSTIAQFSKITEKNLFTSILLRHFRWIFQNFQEHEIAQIAHFCCSIFSYLCHYARSQSLLENLNQKFWLQKISTSSFAIYPNRGDKTSLSKSILTWVAPYLGVLLPSTYTLHICLHVNNKCRNPDFCLFKTFMGGGYCRNTEDVIKGERSYSVDLIKMIEM